MADVSQWSTTASSNNSPSPNGAPEGMAPSGVNNVIRENMAAIAKWYSDSDGTLQSTGSSSAYVLTTNSTHAALADQPLMIFRANHASTGASTLNVDSLGAKSIKKYNDVNLSAGDIETGQIVAVVYNATGDEYELISPTQSDSLVADTSPQLGGFLDPNSNFIGMDKGGDIASSNTMVIDTDGDYFDITGTTTINTMTVAVNRHFFLQFDGALQLTHNSTNLDLPSEGNITTAAGDIGEFFSHTANQVQCVNYTRANGKALAADSGGKVLQVVLGDTTTGVDISSDTLTDTTLTASITCAATSSKVLVLVSQSIDHNGRSIGQLVIKRTISGGATTTIFDAINFGDDDNVRAYHAVYALDSPSTTTALTYKTQMARHDQSGTLNIQRTDGSDSGKSTIVLLEIGA